MDTTETVKINNNKVNVRSMTVTAMLSAIAFVLMFLDTAVPFVPNFIKLDVSELPALMASFALGPVYGVVVCLIKNLLHLFMTSTGGVGELSNFILGVAFVLPAGLIYYRKKTKKNAILGAFVGAFLMAAISFPSNLFIVYPVYYNFMPKDVIIGAYQAVAPFAEIKSIEQCLLMFNVPFTFVKGLISAVITVLIYQPLRPLLKGKN
ncbi:Riboflavin transporter FmnP [Pseudobutyrivibrio sp. NOR37]|uniref:Riboflavin transporter n=1 Tax=Pseudobutyrivibrio xylanivorans TaxID=185007 RepID=A0A6M0LE67_PSEXY|nr:MULTISPECIES: ECF transporter S component [Pseudobutyrivibrio]NEX00390.1 ECF transporter S component [Pseudobutyrivibrio xylanivorans]SFR84636.1 Riboflavin transporter FmnP [Pseudobutyrivibrio sp. NOR37]